MGRIGKLDQRITLQELTKVADGGGGFIEGWDDLPSKPSVWANVLPLSGSEKQESDGINATGRYLVTIRNRKDVSELDRMVWGGETYNIRNIRRAGSRKMYLKFDAERGVTS